MIELLYVTVLYATETVITVNLINPIHSCTR